MVFSYIRLFLNPLCALQVSLAHWNQDEEYGGFGGPHAMVPGGYGALTDALAARLDVRLSMPVASIAYDGDSVQVKAVTGAPSCLASTLPRAAMLCCTSACRRRLRKRLVLGVGRPCYLHCE